MRLPQSNLLHAFAHFVQSPIGLAILLLGIAPVVAAGQQLTCTPSTLQFGVVDVGQTETLMTTVTNSGSTAVTISQVTISNLVFTTSPLSLPVLLPAGQSIDLSVTFTPTAMVWTGGTIKFTSNASNPLLALTVGGQGVGSEALSITPSVVSFGQVAIGTSASVPVTLKNARAWAVTLTGLRTNGSEFSISGQSFPVTLAAGQSVLLNATFNPQSTGTTGGSIFVMGPGIAVPLTGTGISNSSQLSVAPVPMAFGNVPVGTTETLPITMTATGANVTVSSGSSSNSEFVLEATFPFTIPVGQTVTFDVAFTPKSSGSQAGNLTFVSNASNSQAVDSASGTGTVPAYSVNLWWNSSPNVVGYNVYRSTSANGTFSKINATLDSNPAYTDGTVASGTTYYYAATAVNSTGEESARSTPPVQAVI